MENLKIKVIASDLDGTFIDSQKKVPEINSTVINKLIDDGIIFIPTSGRDYPSMRDILHKKIKNIKYYSCFNGARIFKDGKLIHSIKMDKNICKNFIKKGVELGIKYCATSGYNVCYSQLDTEYYNEFENKNSLYTFNSNENHDNFKILDFEKIVFFGENSSLEKLKDFVINNYSDKVNIFFSGNGLIDIVDKKCSKGESIKIIADKLNINLDNIMAFGDNDNDLAMLELVGHPIAMKNSKSSVKEIIKTECEFSNDEGGVGLYLKKYFNNFKEEI